MHAAAQADLLAGASLLQHVEQCLADRLDIAGFPFIADGEIDPDAHAAPERLSGEEEAKQPGGIAFAHPQHDERIIAGDA